MSNADRYTPTLDEAKGYYLGGRAMLAQHPPHPREGEAEFDRLIETAKRDAAREALTLYLGELTDGGEADQLEQFRDQNYARESR